MFGYVYAVSKLTTKKSRNFASSKSKNVAWFVSNMHALNKRLDYVNEISKYIQVLYSVAARELFISGGLKIKILITTNNFDLTV